MRMFKNKGHDKKVLRKKLYPAGIIAVLILMIYCNRIYVLADAATASGMSVFSGVTVSPDGTAWTTDYMDRTNEKLPEGTVCFTGVTSSLRTLQEGEHYYRAPAEGSVHIGKWVVAWRNAQCIHPFKAQSYKGFDVTGNICGGFYNNGWNAYCADCGEKVYDMYVYARMQTVKEITSMPAKGCYLYICPYCRGLEQGTGYQHICKKISYNYYEVHYEKNAPDGKRVLGYMPVTRHMYGNAAIYEGQPASELGFSDTRLRSIRYTCEGYVFQGWNTKPDGTGQFFRDGQEILNLSNVNGAEVILYAQWEQSENALLIDANGGTYAGQKQYLVTRPYRSSYRIQDALLIPAKGYTISFESNGGTHVKDILTKKVFSHWERQGDFQGSFLKNVYTFQASKGHTDRIKAQYTDESFVLPDCYKEQESLVGWYKDKNFTSASLVGRAGETVSISENCVLYAKWEKLILKAEEDYVSCGGTGAVDLFWEQNDAGSDCYKLFQSVDRKHWKEIYADKSVSDTYKLSEVYDADAQGRQFLVENTGYYALTVQGAKGADYDAQHTGGYGGSVSAEYWLKAGDIVTFYAGKEGNGQKGGSNGHGGEGGDSMSALGRGGGAASEVTLLRDGKEVTLLIAGGGGGASKSFSGGAGGVKCSAVSEKKGETGSLGGGGGGAKGGSSNGIAQITDETNTQDYAFQSDLTKYLAKGTAQIYGMSREETQTAIKKVYGNGQNSWRKITKLGTLPLACASSYDIWYGTEEQHFFGYSKGEAVIGGNPYIQVQARDGMTLSLSGTYHTDGNTTLLVGGGLYREDYEAPGHTALLLEVKDAVNGSVLYNKLIYHGYSSNSTAGIAVVEEIDISSAERITITIRSKSEGCQEDTLGHKIFLYFSDILLYGKTIYVPQETVGGSNYINTGFGCKNQKSSCGIPGKSGFVKIEGLDVGYRTGTQLLDVPARDGAAPEKVTAYQVTRSDEKVLKVTLSKPEDHGTVYYHLAKGYYFKEDGIAERATSNITQNVLTTGVKRYYYYVDGKEKGKVSKNCLWTDSDSIMVTMSEPVLYLHVAAADAAGNISETTDIVLENKGNIPIDDSYAEKTKLVTKPLAIKESEFVYKAGDFIYFVKADGRTSHTILAEAYVDGAVTNDYQIDSICFKISDGVKNQWSKVSVPHGEISYVSTRFTNDLLNMSISEGLSLLIPQTAYVERKEHCRSLLLEQSFTVNEETQSFCIYPEAEAALRNMVYTSKEAEDKKNGVTVIPDGTPPYILGIEALQELDILDLEQEMCIELSAGDLESGLREFKVYVQNKDNHMEECFQADADGRISVTVTKDNPLFMGEIAVCAAAEDRVGNASVVGEEGLTFTLDTKLYKQRNPQENVFKTGDGAVLEIETLGYVERIEVFFPDAFLETVPELNRIYEYEYPYLKNKEVLTFSIPLGVEEKEYEVIVKAYKQGQELTSRSVLTVVKGTVLDELRTRIRNNG